MPFLTLIRIKNIIKHDADFLKSQGVMDYSMLLVIEKADFRVDETRNRFMSADGTQIYHVGIIDYLQNYGFQKKMETVIKKFQCLRELKSEISCIPPKQYSERFVEFMNK